MNQEEYALRIERLKGQMYKTAYLYLGNSDMATEALQEAIYKGLKSLKKLRQVEYFDTWMIRIVLNECKQELRRRKREILMARTPEVEAKGYDTLPLKDAICHLPEELKKIVILRFIAGYTLEKTAQILGIPQGTVVTKQRKAMKLLRLELGEEENYESQ